MLLRASLAALAAFSIVIIAGPVCIAFLKRFAGPIASDSPRLNELRRSKAGTSSLGGLFLVPAVVVGILVYGDLANPLIAQTLLLAIGLALIGFWDDLLKLGRGRGISAKAKLSGQTLVALAAVALLWWELAAEPEVLGLRLPLGGSLPLGWGFVPLAVLVIVASSNAVNLADGLDGLAGGCLLFAVVPFGLLAASAGSDWAGADLADQRAELALVAAAMAGGIVGFLWFNCHPAQVFMGDTGSLPLGGLLGWMAVVLGQELLLLVVGGVFVAEAGSVILQVGWFKWRRRRLFLCAPLHHHFQFLGWPENRIVVRFWIVSAFCALVGVGAWWLPRTLSGWEREQRALSPWERVAAQQPGEGASFSPQPTATARRSSFSPEPTATARSGNRENGRHVR